MTEVADMWGGLYMMDRFTDNLYNRAIYILREVEEEGGEDAEVHQNWYGQDWY